MVAWLVVLLHRYLEEKCEQHLFDEKIRDRLNAVQRLKSSRGGGRGGRHTSNTAHVVSHLPGENQVAVANDLSLIHI